MSLTATKAIANGSPSKGNARLVELCLADHVNEERLKAGHPAQAWPSQPAIAKWCNCSRSTVQDALEKLVEIGCIADSGKRKARSVVVWELSLPDQTDSRSGEGAEWDHQTDSRDHQTDSRATRPILGRVPDRPVGNEPVVEPEEEPEGTSPTGFGLSPSGLEQQTANSNPTPTVVAAPTSECSTQAAAEQRQVEEEERRQDLDVLRAQAKKKPDDRHTAAAVKAVEEELGEAA